MAEETKNQGNELEPEKGTEVGNSEQAEAAGNIEARDREEMTEPQAAPEITNNHIAQKRGRMVAAGLIASVILSVIAVTVAGIFQLTSGWLIKCPTDLPVNDPAPILWKDVESREAKSAPLGVPGNLLKEASWKGSPAKTAPSTAESD